MRELAVRFTKENAVRILRFFPGTDQSQLTESDWKTINYCEKHIHKLPYYPSFNEKQCFPQEELQLRLGLLFHKYDMASAIVAFKGGIIERDLLIAMGWGGFDLEDIGCPKSAHSVQHAVCNSSIHSNCHNAHCALADVLSYFYYFTSFIEDEKNRGEFSEGLIL